MKTILNTSAIRNAFRRAKSVGLVCSVRCPEEGDVLCKAGTTEKEFIEAATCMDCVLIVVWNAKAPKGERKIGQMLVVWDTDEGEEIADWTVSDMMNYIVEG